MCHITTINSNDHLNIVQWCVAIIVWPSLVDPAFVSLPQESLLTIFILFAKVKKLQKRRFSLYFATKADVN